MASTSRKRRRSSAGTSKGRRHRVSRSRRHSSTSRSRSSSHKHRCRHKHKHTRSRKTTRKQQPQNVEPTSDVPQKLSVSFAEPESTEAVPYSEKNSASSDNAVTSQPPEKVWKDRSGRLRDARGRFTRE